MKELEPILIDKLSIQLGAPKAITLTVEGVDEEHQYNMRVKLYITNVTQFEVTEYES